MGVLVLAVGTSVPDMIGSMIAAKNGEASVRDWLCTDPQNCQLMPIAHMRPSETKKAMMYSAVC